MTPSTPKPVKTRWHSRGIRNQAVVTRTSGGTTAVACTKPDVWVRITVESRRRCWRVTDNPFMSRSRSGGNGMLDRVIVSGEAATDEQHAQNGVDDRSDDESVVRWKSSNHELTAASG